MAAGYMEAAGVGEGGGSKGKGKGTQSGKESRQDILRRTSGVDWEMRLFGTAVIEELSGFELAEWLREIEAMAKAAGYKVNAEAEQGFRDWLAEALKGGASAAHRATNGAGALPPPPEETLEDGIWTSDPQEVMELRAKKWCKVWKKRPNRLSDIQSVEVMLRGLALQQISEGGHAEIEKGRSWPR